MGIQIKNVGWLSVNPQGGPHDGTYYVTTLPNSGKMIVFRNGPNLSDGTVIKFTTGADVTAFSAADGSKHK